MATELETAQKSYPTATAATKKVLEEIFGKEPFVPKITNAVKTFEGAYPIFKKLKTKDPLWLLLQKRKVSELSVVERLMIIAEVLRNGWEADYEDDNQKKWFPVHIRKGSGFVFSGTVCDYTLAITDCGSRFALSTTEDAEYFGKQFIKEWNELLIIKK